MVAPAKSLAQAVAEMVKLTAASVAVPAKSPVEPVAANPYAALSAKANPCVAPRAKVNPVDVPTAKGKSPGGVGHDDKTMGHISRFDGVTVCHGLQQRAKFSGRAFACL